MSPPDLHPSLTAGPAAKPVCCGCATADDRAVIVPLTPTLFICHSCAGAASTDAFVELQRRRLRIELPALAEVGR